MKKNIIILLAGLLIYVLQTPVNAFGYIGVSIVLSTLYYWLVGFIIQHSRLKSSVTTNFQLLLLLVPNVLMGLVLVINNPILLLYAFPFLSIFAGIALFQGYYFDYKHKTSWLKILLLSIVTMIMVYFITPNIEMYKNTKKVENAYIREDIPLQELDKHANIFIKKGKTYYLNFFHTKCGYCILKFKDVAKINESFKGDTNICILTIADGRWDSLQQVVNCEDLKPYDFKVVYDSSGTFCKALNLYFYPQSMIIDKKGKIVYHFEGYSGDRMAVYKDAVIAKIREVAEYTSFK